MYSKYKYLRYLCVQSNIWLFCTDKVHLKRSDTLYESQNKQTSGIKNKHRKIKIPNVSIISLRMHLIKLNYKSFHGVVVYTSTGKKKGCWFNSSQRHKSNLGLWQEGHLVQNFSKTNVRCYLLWEQERSQKGYVLILPIFSPAARNVQPS